MFRLNLGDTPCQLKEKDFKKLDKSTPGYSGADIAVLVRDALMAPIRKIQAATHFKEVFLDKICGKHQTLMND